MHPLIVAGAARRFWHACRLVSVVALEGMIRAPANGAARNDNQKTDIEHSRGRLE
jgi:hypothetical protein